MPEQRPFIIAHLSDLHCGSPYFVANLLERAGVDTVKELATRVPENLARSLGEAGGEAGTAPSLDAVTAWVAQAKTMEPRVAH